MINEQTYRVIDLGVAFEPRLEVEIRQQPDGMGGLGWSRFDPIPTLIFSHLLIDSGVVT